MGPGTYRGKPVVVVTTEPSKKSWYEDLFTSPQKEVPLAKDIPEKGQQALDQIFAKKQASLNASKPQETPAVAKTKRTTTRPSSVPSQIAPPSIAPIAPPQEDKPWYSSLFSGGTPTKPGEYSGLREFGMGTAQFLGNLGNNLTKNYAGNKALNAGFAQKRLEYADRDPASNSSVLTRGMARALGMPIKGDESAFNLKQQMPYVRDMLAARAMQGREGGGDVSMTKDQKDVSQYASEVQGFKTALKNYAQNVKNISLNPLDTSKESAKTQRADLIFKLKDLAKTGALDQGTIDLANELLPTADYTRNEVVDAKVNSFLQTLDERVKSKERGAGTRVESYSEEPILVKDKKTGRTMRVNPRTGEEIMDGT